MSAEYSVLRSVQHSRMKLHILRFVIAAVLVTAPGAAHGQRVAKYGADFLAGGVGARALGMGGAHVALTQNVNSGYWNAAGLSHTVHAEVAYMHAERFAGIVTFDYAGLSFPVTSTSTVGLSYYRSGVNDIKNTLNAWDVVRNQPKAHPETYITTFSAADAAFFVSYARSVWTRLAVGVSAKIIRRSIGDFANAWGYSFDIGAQFRGRRFLFGANLQDASTMLQSWSINEAAFTIEGTNPDTGEQLTFEEVFDQELPTGQTFLVLPVLRLGSGIVLPIGLGSTLTAGMDLDVAFDGQKANSISAGAMSLHPRLGTEFKFRGVVALRAGISHLGHGGDYGFDFVPSIGAGLDVAPFAVDYGFGDFGGLSSDLGYSHRISVRFALTRDRFARDASDAEG